MTTDDITVARAVAAGLALATDSLGGSPLFTHTWPNSENLNAQLRQVVLGRTIPTTAC
jgi:hypothetical protein